MTVISRTAETNAVSDYFVSRLAGPRIGKRRVQKGDKLSFTEYQARALVLSGDLVDDVSKVDDPFGEVAATKAREEAAAKALAGTDHHDDAHG